jgi:phosphatidylglycerol:prolipoprotein diacylglycerol transferase
MNAGLVALIGALVGGRAAYVIVNWGYYGSHPLEALYIQSGGLAWAGALAGAVLALVLFASLNRRVFFWKAADALTPLLGLLAISAWLGCWFVGSAYGSAASGWWGIPARDEWGLVSKRFPLQLLAAALAALLFWSLERFAGRRKPRPGTIAGLAWLGLSLLLLIVSLLRADPAPPWAGLRLETWGAILFTVLALGTLVGLNLAAIRDKLSSLASRQESPPLSTRDGRAG